MSEYTKLSSLVDSQFRVGKVLGFKWKMWSQEQGRMLISDSYEKGYRKLYQVQTDKGIMDVSAGQLGNMLESVSEYGKADIINRTFSVKSNGKTGMDIRYYINPVKEQHVEADGIEEDPNDLTW